MKKNQLTISSLTALFLITGSFFLLSAQDAGSSSTQTRSIKPVYIFPAGKQVRYLDKTKIKQTMDIQGQSMSVNIDLAFGCTVEPAGRQGDDLKLHVKVDTLWQHIDSPQGTSGGSVNELKGRSFMLVLSQSGREKDLSEAEAIKFTASASGATNLGQSFADFFPDLPEKPVRPGDTWMASDTIISSSESAKLKMIVNSVNRYEGIEMSGGEECARITSVLSGMRYMKTISEGMDIETSGPFNGKGEVYFNLKEGYYVKRKTETKMIGELLVTSPQEMSFPVVLEQVTICETVK